MTREEKIEFLSRYIEIDEEISRLCSEVSMWRARATKITPTFSDMPKGGQQDDKIQSAVEKIMELEQEINAEIDTLQKVRGGSNRKAEAFGTMAKGQWQVHSKPCYMA